MRNITSLDNLEHLTKCPLCGKKYQYGNTLLLEETEERTAFHLTCDSCKTAILVFLSAGRLGIASVGMITDLCREEAKKLFGQEAVTANQVIEVHEFLKNFDGRVEEFI
jgi:hypothetical protein